MKKFMALFLASMMLMGSVAMAAESNMEQVAVDTPTEAATGNFNQTNKDPATQKTDVWLQVDASGQISATVPLFVVFKTDIDGGTADTSNAYKIVNKSTAGIKVTQVDVTDDTSITAGAGNMTPTKDSEVAFNTNQYNLKISARDYAKKDETQDAAKYADIGDVFDTENFSNNSSTYTKTAADNGALWTIGYANESDNNDESHVKLTLKTGPLDFVTKADTAEEGKSETTTTHYGVKLFSVKYTIKIDDTTSGAIGEAIKGSGEGSGVDYEYTTTTQNEME